MRNAIVTMLITLAGCRSAHASPSPPSLTVEALAPREVSNPVVHHFTLRPEAGPSICAASETTWASRVAPHDTLVLCLPTGWNGTGEVSARLGVSTPFGAPRPGRSALVYHGETTLRVRGSRSSVEIDVPTLTLTGIGFGSAADLSGLQINARVRGSLALVP